MIHCALLSGWLCTVHCTEWMCKERLAVLFAGLEMSSPEVVRSKPRQPFAYRQHRELYHIDDGLLKSATDVRCDQWSVEASQCYGFCVGISHSHMNRGLKLKGSGWDALLVVRHLVSVRGFPVSQVRWFTDLRASEVKMMREKVEVSETLVLPVPEAPTGDGLLAGLRQTVDAVLGHGSRRTVLVMSFAGHCTVSQGWLPVDTHLHGGIPGRVVRGELARLPATCRVLVLLDMCHGDAFLSDLSGLDADVHVWCASRAESSGAGVATETWNPDYGIVQGLLTHVWLKGLVHGSETCACRFLRYLCAQKLLKRQHARYLSSVSGASDSHGSSIIGSSSSSSSSSSNSGDEECVCELGPEWVWPCRVDKTLGGDGEEKREL